MSKSEGFVRKQKEECRKIQKEITPKLVKQLYNEFRHKKAVQKVETMTNAFISALLNKEHADDEDIHVIISEN